jgi:hypothetical protein
VDGRDTVVAGAAPDMGQPSQAEISGRVRIFASEENAASHAPPARRSELPLDLAPRPAWPASPGLALACGMNDFGKLSSLKNIQIEA